MQFSDNQRPATVASAIRWTYLAAMFNGLLQIVLLATMARLVDPHEFGILATGLLVLKAFQVLIQSGYERAVIWADNLAASCLAGLFWTSIFAGAAITASIILVSDLISVYLKEPGLKAALISLSPMAVLVAPGLVSRGVLRRSMRFREIAFYEIGAYVIGFVVVGLTLALNGWGLWALVAANLVQCALQGVLPFAIAPHPIFHRFSFRDIAAPMRFGYSVSGLGIIEFLDAQATPMFIAHFFGMSSLGNYNRAYALIQLPLEQIGTSLTRVLFSPFNRSRGSAEILRNAVVSPLRALGLLIIPMALGGGAAAPLVIETMLGVRWEQSAPIFAALCVGSAAAVIGNLLAALNEALGLLREKAAAQVAITSLLALCLLTFGTTVLTTAAICFSFTRVLFLVAQIVLAAPRLRMSRLQLSAVLAPGAFVGILVASAVFIISKTAVAFALPAWIGLILTIAAAAVGTAAGGLTFSAEIRAHVWPAVRRLHAREN